MTSSTRAPLGRRPFLARSGKALASGLVRRAVQTRLPSVEAPQDGSTTLAVTISQDITNLDAARTFDVYSSWVQAQICEPLFVVAPDFSITANLVASFEQPDPLTYVYHLYDGISFQDGTPLDAEAVRW